MPSHKFFVLVLLNICFPLLSQQKYTHADTLKGAYTAQRAWWNVLHYDLRVEFNPSDSSISGTNLMTYKVIDAPLELQLDLLSPMVLDSVVQDNSACGVRRDGDAYFITVKASHDVNSVKQLQVFFHGRPRVAKSPPWDGGVIWSRDTKGNNWISIACQGMAARVWFPNKDHQADEPDSVDLHFTAPSELVVVSNGRLDNVTPNASGRSTYHWIVKNPINNYNIIPYIGRYAMIRDTLNGKSGTLDLSYWVLLESYEKAKIHFSQVKPMLRCFEEWFGPFPFYGDGYKLVEAPFLGMEHQTAIAYGNEFKQGYKGRDLSLTGWGLKWDFIIVHESGHEWFGNSITAKDVADNWIHESFTAYSENLYTEYLFGKKAGAEYVIGTRGAILNDKPIISDYDVNAGGSLDLYYKGANMLHTIRQIVNNDSLWKETLRGLNKTFRHQTVTTRQVEDYLKSALNTDLQMVFDQYLRTVNVPVFEYKLKGRKLSYRWTNVIKGFNMPMLVHVGSTPVLLHPTEKKQKMQLSDPLFKPDLNYYVGLKKLN
jgi:aminopeptidase N